MSPSPTLQGMFYIPNPAGKGGGTVGELALGEQS